MEGHMLQAEYCAEDSTHEVITEPTETYNINHSISLKDRETMNEFMSRLDNKTDFDEKGDIDPIIELENTTDNILEQEDVIPKPNIDIDEMSRFTNDSIYEENKKIIEKTNMDVDREETDMDVDSCSKDMDTDSCNKTIDEAMDVDSRGSESNSGQFDKDVFKVPNRVMLQNFSDLQTKDVLGYGETTSITDFVHDTVCLEQNTLVENLNEKDDICYENSSKEAEDCELPSLHKVDNTATDSEQSGEELFGQKTEESTSEVFIRAETTSLITDPSLVFNNFTKTDPNEVAARLVEENELITENSDFLSGNMEELNVKEIVTILLEDIIDRVVLTTYEQLNNKLDESKNINSDDVFNLVNDTSSTIDQVQRFGLKETLIEDSNEFSPVKEKSNSEIIVKSVLDNIIDNLDYSKNVHLFNLELNSVATKDNFNSDKTEVLTPEQENYLCNELESVSLNNMIIEEDFNLAAGTDNRTQDINSLNECETTDKVESDSNRFHVDDNQCPSLVPTCVDSLFNVTQTDDSCDPSAESACVINLETATDVGTSNSLQKNNDIDENDSKCCQGELDSFNISNDSSQESEKLEIVEIVESLLVQIVDDEVLNKVEQKTISEEFETIENKKESKEESDSTVLTEEEHLLLQEIDETTVTEAEEGQDEQLEREAEVEQICDLVEEFAMGSNNVVESELVKFPVQTDDVDNESSLMIMDSQNILNDHHTAVNVGINEKKEDQPINTSERTEKVEAREKMQTIESSENNFNIESNHDQQIGVEVCDDKTSEEALVILQVVEELQNILESKDKDPEIGSFESCDLVVEPTKDSEIAEDFDESLGNVEGIEEAPVEESKMPETIKEKAAECEELTQKNVTVECGSGENSVFEDFIEHNSVPPQQCKDREDNVANLTDSTSLKEGLMGVEVELSDEKIVESKVEDHNTVPVELQSVTEVKQISEQLSSLEKESVVQVLEEICAGIAPCQDLADEKEEGGKEIHEDGEERRVPETYSLNVPKESLPNGEQIGKEEEMSHNELTITEEDPDKDQENQISGTTYRGADVERLSNCKDDLVGQIMEEEENEPETRVDNVVQDTSSIGVTEKPMDVAENIVDVRERTPEPENTGVEGGKIQNNEIVNQSSLEREYETRQEENVEDTRVDKAYLENGALIERSVDAEAEDNVDDTKVEGACLENSTLIETSMEAEAGVYMKTSCKTDNVSKDDLQLQTDCEQIKNGAEIESQVVGEIDGTADETSLPLNEENQNIPPRESHSNENKQVCQCPNAISMGQDPLNEEIPKINERELSPEEDRQNQPIETTEDSQAQSAGPKDVEFTIALAKKLGLLADEDCKMGGEINYDSVGSTDRKTVVYENVETKLQVGSTMDVDWSEREALSEGRGNLEEAEESIEVATRTLVEEIVERVLDEVTVNEMEQDEPTSTTVDDSLQPSMEDLITKDLENELLDDNNDGEVEVNDEIEDMLLNEAEVSSTEPNFTLPCQDASVIVEDIVSEILDQVCPPEPECHRIVSELLNEIVDNVVESCLPEGEAVVLGIMKDILELVVPTEEDTTLVDETMFPAQLVQVTSIGELDFENMGSTDSDGDDGCDREYFVSSSTGACEEPTETFEGFEESCQQVTTTQFETGRKLRSSIIKTVKQEKIDDWSVNVHVKEEVVDYDYEYDIPEKKPVLPSPEELQASLPLLTKKGTVRKRPGPKGKRNRLPPVQTNIVAKTTRRGTPAKRKSGTPPPAVKRPPPKLPSPKVKEPEVPIVASYGKAIYRGGKPKMKDGRSKTNVQTPVTRSRPRVKTPEKPVREVVKRPSSTESVTPPRRIINPTKKAAKPVTRRSAPELPGPSAPLSPESVPLSSFTRKTRKTVGAPLPVSPVEKKIKKIDEPVVEKDKKVKIRNVAVKSTTPTVSKKDVKINVAKKSTTQVTARPQPIFVDTTFDSHTIDMFINENDDSDEDFPLKHKTGTKRKHAAGDNWLYRPGPSFKSRKTSSSEKCSVKLDRMPILDQLLPHKKSPEKVEPNICELCDPKRIFLSKSALTDHIEEEHVGNSSTTEQNGAPSDITISISENADTCFGCKKKFHSKNRLIEHIQTCKLVLEMPSKNNEILNEDDNMMPHVCRICNKRFMMAAGLGAHMKTHKTTKHNRESDPLNVERSADELGNFYIHTKTIRQDGKIIIKIKREKKTVYCKVCKKAFHNPDSLIEHELKHEKSRTVRKNKYGFDLNKVKIEREESPEIEIIEERFGGQPSPLPPPPPASQNPQQSAPSSKINRAFIRKPKYVKKRIGSRELKELQKEY